MASQPIRMTPVVYTRGIYSLRSPFVAASDKLYKCTAVRGYRELIDNGEDIFKLYYEPQGLSKSNYQEDLQVDACICALRADTGETVYVPDTYIVGLPDQSVPEIGLFVVSAIIGPVRLNVDLSHMKAKVAEIISDTTGLEPEVNVDVLDNNNVMTPVQAASLETARIARIKNRETTYAEVLRLRTENAELREQVRILTDLLKPAS